jgi:nitrate reductase gamma subunit
MGGGSDAGKVAAGVIGSLIGVAVLAGLAAFLYKRKARNGGGPPRVYSSFDNEMTRVR